MGTSLAIVVWRRARPDGGRVEAANVMDQIAWYKSQGMVKPEVDGAKIIDMRYAVALPRK